MHLKYPHSPRETARRLILFRISGPPRLIRGEILERSIFRNILSEVLEILIRHVFYDNLRIAIYKLKKYCKMSKCERFYSRL